MSNVKPGDIAKVVHDPQEELLGLQVLVLGEVRVNDSGGLLQILEVIHAHGHIWDCQVLEHRRWTCQDCGKLHFMKAGETYAIPDRWLKRIDPPEDNEELYRDSPIEGDKIKEIV